MTEEELPVFPPLYEPQRISADADPFEAAIEGAKAGDDGGALYWCERADRMQAALVLAPETPLSASLAMVMAAEQALTDAMGALTPPEIAVEWAWPDRLLVNGARCGTLRVACDARDPEVVPDWLVVSPTVQLAALDASMIGAEPGERPDLTALTEEGGVAVGAMRLMESWSKHLLVWINAWEEDGFGPLHEAWRGRSLGIGQRIALNLPSGSFEGLYLGLDETGDLLLKTDAETRALPLSTVLDHPSPWPPQGGPHLRILKEDGL